MVTNKELLREILKEIPVRIEKIIEAHGIKLDKNALLDKDGNLQCNEGFKNEK